MNLRSARQRTWMAEFGMVALFVAYDGYGLYASAMDKPALWNAVLAMAPILLGLYGLLGQNVGATARRLLIACMLLVTAWALPRLTEHLSWLYFTQHIAINSGLGYLFGKTLLPGQEPLCTFFARYTHESCGPAVIRYTRQVTIAWTVFFVAITVVSVALFAMAPLRTWLVFADVLTLPLVGLMFVIESLVQRRVLAPQDRVSITTIIAVARSAMGSRTQAKPLIGGIDQPVHRHEV